MSCRWSIRSCFYGDDCCGTVSDCVGPLSANSGKVEVRTTNGTAGWVSDEYLKAHPDAIPGMTYDPSSTGPVKPDGAMQPDSASGCDLNVCINIDGDSTLVTNWTTTAYGNTRCANAYFAYHAAYNVGPTVCPDGGSQGVYYDSTGPTGYFPDGDQLCNYGQNGPSGEPCEYIQM